MRLMICLPILHAVLLAQGISIRYDTLPPDDINRRLAEVKETNSKREQQLHMMFQEAGCDGENLREEPVKHSHDPNVVCTLPGQTDSKILVGAHFDFVSAGRGVVDNWTGCSLLPSFYQSLKVSSRHHTFVFVGFTDEEKGLVGSKFYVHELSKEDLLAIRAMIDLDSLGTSPTKLDLNRGDKALADALATVASSTQLPLSVMNIGQLGGADSDPFQQHHVPTITIHSMTNETWQILHSPRDQATAVNSSAYYETYRLTIAYLAYLDETLNTAAEPDRRK